MLNLFFLSYVRNSTRMKEEMEIQLQEKEAAKKREQELEKKYSGQITEHNQVSQFVEADHQQARREYMRYLMEENKKVCCNAYYINSYC